MAEVQALGFGLVTASLIAIGAMGFTLQFGLTNVLNISYGGAMTVGAFAAFVAEELHLPVALAAALAVAAGAGVTWLLGRTLFAFYARRGAGLFEMVMVTLAVSLVIQFGIDAASREQIYRFTFPQGESLHWGWFMFTVAQLVLVGCRRGHICRDRARCCAGPGLARRCGRWRPTRGWPGPAAYRQARSSTWCGCSAARWPASPGWPT